MTRRGVLAILIVVGTLGMLAGALGLSGDGVALGLQSHPCGEGTLDAPYDLGLHGDRVGGPSTPLEHVQDIELTWDHPDSNAGAGSLIVGIVSSLTNGVNYVGAGTNGTNFFNILQSGPASLQITDEQPFHLFIRSTASDATQNGRVCVWFSFPNSTERHVSWVTCKE